jgi:allophanate hydrolase subunit 2/allophanate hydrolase subunit 1
LFHESAVIAVCGALLPVTIDGINQPMWSRVIVNKGQTLRLGSVGGDGLRAYIAFKGGFPQISSYLGSKSTSPELQLGGLQGRRLQANDILELSPESSEWATIATPLSLPHQTIPDYDISEIYCLQGPFGSEEILTQEGQDTILTSTWIVGPNSGRSGVRLEGPRLKWARASGGGGGSHPSNVFDYGYPNGGVNWTGEYPVIFARDRPDLGGFACPITVCSGEMWKVGQLKPGGSMRFRLTTFENAMKISRAKDVWLSDLHLFATGEDKSISSYRIELGPETTSSILKSKPASNANPRVTFRQGGDTSIIVEFGEQVADLRNTASVKLLSERLDTRNLDAVRYEPNLATLTVHYDPFKLSQSELLQILDELNSSIGEISGVQVPVREIHLPLCLDHPSIQEATQRYMESIRPTAAYLPDNVEYIRKGNALQSRQDVFNSLLKTPWLTVAVGFFVGTPILFPLDPRYLYTGQKYNPNRSYTPSGSVGLGGSLLALYPIASPGGYQLMARTLSTWDSAGTRPGFSPSRPWLFKYFDIVKFHEVTEAEFDKAESDFLAGRYAFNITDATLDLDPYIAKFDAAGRDPEWQEWRKRQALAAVEMGELEHRLFDEWSAAKAVAGATENRDDLDSPGIVRIESPIDANVWKVQVKVGDVLQKGQVVVILEAMKMEINVYVNEAQEGARVTSILCKPGSVTSPGSTILAAKHD